jgi:ribosomal protein L32
MEPSRRPQWWLIGIAALLAGIFLFDSVGSWAAVGLAALGIAALAGYHWSRTSKPAPRCLNCGETLNPNATECASCGSASWTYKN